MTKTEVVKKMTRGHEVYTTYIGKKFYTAYIDGVSIDVEMFAQMIDGYNNIICSYFTKPDQWDETSKGSAIYKWL